MHCSRDRRRRVDGERCQGHTLCKMIAPDSFELDDIDGTSSPVSELVPPDREDAVREADIAIDGVPDELESKLEIFSMIDRMAPPRTVLCSPLRAVSIADLATCTYRAAQCIGVRVEREFVELEHATFTDPQVIDRVAEFWRSLGKEVRVTADTREFAGT